MIAPFAGVLLVIALFLAWLLDVPARVRFAFYRRNLSRALRIAARGAKTSDVRQELRDLADDVDAWDFDEVHNELDSMSAAERRALFDFDNHPRE